MTEKVAQYLLPIESYHPIPVQALLTTGNWPSLPKLYKLLVISQVSFPNFWTRHELYLSFAKDVSQNLATRYYFFLLSVPAILYLLNERTFHVTKDELLTKRISTFSLTAYLNSVQTNVVWYLLTSQLSLGQDVFRSLFSTLQKDAYDIWFSTSHFAYGLPHLRASKELSLPDDFCVVPPEKKNLNALNIVLLTNWLYLYEAGLTVFATFQNWQRSLDLTMGQTLSSRTVTEIPLDKSKITLSTLINREGGSPSTTLSVLSLSQLSKSLRKSYSGNEDLEAKIDFLNKHKHLMLRLVPTKEIKDFLDRWKEKDEMFDDTLGLISNNILLELQQQPQQEPALGKTRLPLTDAQSRLRSWITEAISGENVPTPEALHLVFTNLFFLYHNVPKASTLQETIGNFIRRLLTLTFVDHILSVALAFFNANWNALKDQYQILGRWIELVTTNFQVKSTLCPQNKSFEMFLQAINDPSNMKRNIWLQVFLSLLQHTEDDTEKLQYKALTLKMRGITGFCL